MQTDTDADIRTGAGALPDVARLEAHVDGVVLDALAALVPVQGLAQRLAGVWSFGC